MNLTTALQALSEPLLEPKIDEYWQRLLWQTVEQQLHETCFLMYKDAERLLLADVITLVDEVPVGVYFEKLYAAACDHCQCVEFWYSLLPAERAQKFYCLGAPSWCSSCGTQINSIVFAKEDKLSKNACPACGVVREDVRLVRDDWWAALANTAGATIAALDDTTRTVIVQLIEKLAHFYVRGRIITYADTNPARNAATLELFNLLYEQFGDSRRTACYEAARWAVWRQHIEETTGLHLMDLAPTLRAALMPALLQADTEPGIVEQIQGVLDEELSYADKSRKLRRLAHRDTPEHEPEPRALAVRVVSDAEEFLVVKINGNLDKLRSHLDIRKDVDVANCLPEGLDGWLADIFTEDV